MSEELAGRVAVISGSASGVGRATAELFVAEGATVIGIDIDQKRNEELEQQFPRQVICLTVDIGSPSQVATACLELQVAHPVVDILFNNAAGVQVGTWEQTTPQIWDRMVAVNLSGAFHLTQGVLGALKKSGKGSVIHHSSVDGVLGNPSIAAYSTAKAGLGPMTHLMAWEFAKYGIRVNSIVSGGLDTPMIALASAEILEKLKSATSLRRLGRAEEIAEVALFLASDRSSFVTGSAITAEGGRIGLTHGTY